MSLWTRLTDRRKAKKARGFSQELAYNFYQSPMCSDYENLFAQVRPLVNEMKVIFPYGVGRNGAKLPAKSTPELQVLHDPNDDMGWAEFADAMFSTWLTENELDINVHFDERGGVEGYTILPPQTRQYLGNGRWQWQVMTADGMEMLDGSTVARLRFSRSPRDLQRGVSPASSVRVWAQIDDLISQYQRAYFENGAIPATITFISASTEAKYLETRSELENNLRGAKNRNKTIYAWRQFDNDTGASADQIEVKTIQGTNSTLAIRDIVSIINDRLNKSVGVSNFLLGDDSSAKYDNAELSNEQFIRRRVYPALCSFWDQFQHELDRITGGLGYGISFDLQIPELTDRKRAVADMNKVNADTLVSLITAGAGPAATVQALGLSDAWLKVAYGVYSERLAGKIEPSASTDKAQGGSKTLAPSLATVDTAPGLEAVEKTADKLPPMSADERKIYDMLVDLAEKIQADTSTEFDFADIVDEMTDVLAKSAQDGGGQAVKALEMLSNADVAGEIAQLVTDGDVFLSEKLKNSLRDRADELTRGFSDFVREETLEVLNSPVELGASEIKSRLAQVMPRDRAELIARNEVNYAVRSGRLQYDQDLADRLGLSVRLVWHARHDAKTCDVCRVMDGKSVTLGDAFAHDELEDGLSWEASRWNDDGRIPMAHPNCRCYFDEELIEGAEDA